MMRTWFPFIYWFKDIRYLTAGGVAGRMLMVLAVILIAGLTARTKNNGQMPFRRVFLVCIILWLGGEILYRVSHTLVQFAAILIGVPSFLAAIGILLGWIILNHRTLQN